MYHCATTILKLTLALLALILCCIGAWLLFLLLTQPIPEAYRVYLYWIVPAYYLSLIPSFLGLRQGYRLLRSMETGLHVLEVALDALHRITQCIIALGIISLLLAPVWIRLAAMDDAPGAALIGMSPVCLALLATSITITLSHLLQQVTTPSSGKEESSATQTDEKPA